MRWREAWLGCQFVRWAGLGVWRWGQSCLLELDFRRVSARRLRRKRAAKTTSGVKNQSQCFC